MEAIEMEGLAVGGTETVDKHFLKKPGWIKRRIVWPSKTKILQTLPFKVCALIILLGGYLTDVVFDTDSGVSWFNMRNCHRTIYVNLDQIKSSEMIEFEPDNFKENFRELLNKYGTEKESVKDGFKKTFVWNALEFLTGEFLPCAGYHTNMNNHNNILRLRLQAFLKGTLSSFNSSTIIRNCKMNHKQISIANIMDEICPQIEKSQRGLFGSDDCGAFGNDARSILHKISKIFRKIEKKVTPELLIEGMLSLRKMNSTDINVSNMMVLLMSLPEKARSVFTKALPVMLREKISLGSLYGCFMNKNKWIQLLSYCGKNDMEIECKETSKDFCENGEIGFGSMVIAAVFLPGLIQAVGNIIFYKAKEFPIGFGMCSLKPGTMRYPLRFLLFIVYIPYMVCVGPLHPLYSFYLLISKYFQEVKNGIIVEDGGDSRKDEVFLRFKEEKSAEGLSESIVQFTTQFCFMVFFIFMSQIEDFVPGFTSFLTFNDISQERFLASWVPKTVVKSILSLWTFSFGVITCLQTDKLFQRRGIRTKFSKKIKEIILMLTLTSFMSFLPILYISFMILFSIMIISSWSWTDEEPEARHYLFLLPFLPLALIPLFQFILFQRFVKPKTAREQWFAFLSIIIPVRVYLIKDVDQAYKYFLASSLNICLTLPVSWALLLFAISNLSEIEDPDNGFLTFMCEVPMPLIFYFILHFFIASRLIWYLVIAPDFATVHSMPDFQPVEERLASFPGFWNFKFQNFLMQEVTYLNIHFKDLSNVSVTESEMVFLEKVAKERRENNASKEDIEQFVENQDLTPHMELSALSKAIVNTQRPTLNIKVPYNEILSKNVRHIHRMTWILDNFNARNFAKKGFFYCHPRMTRLQIACYSCGLLLSGEECLSEDLDSQHHSSCRRYSITENSQSSELIPLRILPWCMVQVALMISTFLILHIEGRTMAHGFYSFLIISLGINLNIVSQLHCTGPELSNIFKGITNYFCPLFIPSDPSKLKRQLFVQLSCRVITNLGICFVTAFFKQQKEISMVFRIDHILQNHWAGLFLSLLSIAYTTIKYIELSGTEEEETRNAKKDESQNETGVLLVANPMENGMPVTEEVKINSQNLDIIQKTELPLRSSDDCTTLPCSSTTSQSFSPKVFSLLMKICKKEKIRLYIDIVIPIISVSVIFFIASSLFEKKAHYNLKDCDATVDGVCFKLLTDDCPCGCTYQESQDICQRIGGKLAEPRTMELIKMIKVKLNKYKDTHWWIGASDRHEENNWVWESDKASIGPIKGAWAAGEPNNYRGNQDCARLDDFICGGDQICINLDDINCETRKKESQVFKPICQFKY